MKRAPAVVESTTAEPIDSQFFNSATPRKSVKLYTHGAVIARTDNITHASIVPHNNNDELIYAVE